MYLQTIKQKKRAIQVLALYISWIFLVQVATIIVMFQHIKMNQSKRTLRAFHRVIQNQQRKAHHPALVVNTRSYKFLHTWCSSVKKMSDSSTRHIALNREMRLLVKDMSYVRIVIHNYIKVRLHFYYFKERL